MTCKVACARSRSITARICPHYPFAMLVFLLNGTLASGLPQAESGVKPIRIEVQDATGVVIAGPGEAVRKNNGSSVTLAFDREYQPGDRIVVSGPQQIVVRLDESVKECSLTMAESPATPFSFEIPYGEGEPQTRSAYSPKSFTGTAHQVTARVLTKQERSTYRNLALNPCDQQLKHTTVEELDSQQAAAAFPHATTNSVSRELPDFRARNAIDGETENGHHGVWPYQSWGPGLRDDLWWKIDFGRAVEIDKIRLMVRADFPHDSYWHSAVVEFSDGQHLPITIKPAADFQDFTFPKRSVSWIRLSKLVPEDPTRWCSFIEVEAWGRDLR
jgi:hypothetical protein